MNLVWLNPSRRPFVKRQLTETTCRSPSYHTDDGSFTEIVVCVTQPDNCLVRICHYHDNGGRFFDPWKEVIRFLRYDHMFYYLSESVLKRARDSATCAYVLDQIALGPSLHCSRHRAPRTVGGNPMGCLEVGVSAAVRAAMVCTDRWDARLLSPGLLRVVACL